MWTTLACKNKIRLWHRVQVQSYVRPPFAARMAAGPDGSSQAGSQSIIRAVSAEHYSGCPSRRPDRYAINLFRPRNLLYRQSMNHAAIDRTN
jgi:hypothetical protein